MKPMKALEIEMEKKHYYNEPIIGDIPTPVQDVLLYTISKHGTISLNPIIIPIILN
jgi:hypothetical protein